MRILFLTQVLPYPPDSGPKVKTWNVLKFLSQEHEITLASFVRGDQSADVAQLKPYCRAIHTVPIQRSKTGDIWSLIRSLLTGKPWMMVRDERRAMTRLVDRLAGENSFDAVHADQLNMAQYAARLSRARKTLDAHNALWLLYRRVWETTNPGPMQWLLGRDWKLLKEYEGRICREFDNVIAVSDEDKAALLEAADVTRPITVTPIAVDTDLLQPVSRQADACDIVHVGTMYWPPNIDGVEWFIQRVYPLVREKHPQTVFDVVGARPPQSLLAWNRDGEGINITGYVPDVLPYLQKAGVFVVPLRAGGGMRVKILEALARAMPLVTTTIGCEGIALQHEVHALIADTPADFAEAVVRLLDDPALAARLGQNGRQLIEERYDFRIACAPLTALYS